MEYKNRLKLIDAKIPDKVVIHNKVTYPPTILTGELKDFPYKLRYIGSIPYLGFDDNGRRELKCKELDFVMVSREKARQLLIDFPETWIHIASYTKEPLW